MRLVGLWAICLAVAMAALPVAGAQQTPELLRLTLGATADDEDRGPPIVTKLEVHWTVQQPYTAVQAPHVAYRVNNGTEQTAPARLVGQTRDYVPVDEGLHIDYHYAARIGLTRGSTVTYKVGVTGAMSDEVTARMIPNPTETMRIAVLSNIAFQGYSRETGMRIPGAEAPAETTIAQILNHTPHLVLIPGNLGMSSSSGPWSGHQRMMEPLVSRVAMMAVPGDNDDDGDFHQLRERFVFPGVERTYGVEETADERFYYGFNARSAYFIGLNSVEICQATSSQDPAVAPCFEGRPDGVQLEWLKEALEDATEDLHATFLIAFFYHSPFVAADDGSDIRVKQLWNPQLEAFNVDLVLTGQEWVYQRTYPMRGDTIQTTNQTDYRQGEGTVYAVTGGAGHYSAPAFPTLPNWLAYTNSSQHFVLLELDNKTLTVKAIASQSGEILDEFTIHKAQSPDYPTAERRNPPPPGQDSPGPWPTTALLAVALALWMRARRKPTEMAP